MPITVNGVELSDAEIERELPRHQGAGDPLRLAVIARILRRVLLDEAARLGLDTADEEEAVGGLLARQAASPAPDEAACRRFYLSHPERFMAGECLEAEHILFQVTPDVDLEALRARASQVLSGLLDDPSRFAERARELSNCPSAAIGGSLGQLTRGDTVPEFERAVFALPAGAMLPRLLQTRYGLHIVRVTRRVEGRLLPYERVAGDIADVLTAMSRDTAWRQYVKVLVGRARIEGMDLEE
ncbi:MAG: peptidyl-prolyl cis-trans isomerase [Rhodocyclaceae bacterium]|nr:peptidyl-prolyl cis-trans isomerase [Rhodocyclaceae bacterium]